MSEAGKPLLVGGCQDAVQRMSRTLGIVTDAGKVPAPHRYRHSLGTLNVGELGMRLTPFYLMRRYRHNDIRTTMQVYVTSNPLLDEAQHMAIVGAANGNGHAAGQDPTPRSMASDIRVPEQEAMARARQLGVNWRSLREHAVGQRAAVQRGTHVYYSRAFIDRLCTEWMTREEAARLMGLGSVHTLRYHVRNQGFRTLVVGRASLVAVADVMQFFRGNGKASE